jgi:hypothetical protein
MPKAPAKWTTNPKEVSVTTGADGTWHLVAPLYDNGVKAVTFDVTITAERFLQFLALNEPGAAGLQGFQAWSREG